MLLGGACFAGAIGSLNQHLKLILKNSGFTSQELLDHTYSRTLFALLVTSAVGRLAVGRLSDAVPKRRVLTVAFVLLAASLPALYHYRPPATPYLFSVPFGLAMGGDFLLVALMAADRFGVSSLMRVLAILLPAMTVGQTWAPYFIAVLREYYGNYRLPLAAILLLATAGWVALTFFLRASREEVDAR